MDITIPSIAAVSALILASKKKYYKRSNSVMKEINDNLHQTKAPKDGIESINNPFFMSASSVDGEISDYEEVLALHHGSRSYVFPLKSLAYHHVVNFKSGNTDISVTHCPVSGTSRCFKGHKFGTTGKVYNANMILYDKKDHGEVSQLLGRRVNGKGTGKYIASLPLQRTTWGQWKQFYPHSKVMSLRKDKFHMYQFDMYPWLNMLLHSWYPVKEKSNLFKKDELMHCFEYNGQALAIPKEKFRHLGQVSCMMGNKNIKLVYNYALDTIDVFQNKEKLDSFDTYWFAWHASHPDTKSLVL